MNEISVSNLVSITVIFSINCLQTLETILKDGGVIETRSVQEEILFLLFVLVYNGSPTVLSFSDVFLRCHHLLCILSPVVV